MDKHAEPFYVHENQCMQILDLLSPGLITSLNKEIVRRYIEKRVIGTFGGLLGVFNQKWS